MRLTHLALATTLSLIFGTHAHAQDTCGELCNPWFWNTATPAEISEAIATVGVNARTGGGFTPLMSAAGWGTPQNVIALLKAGADLNAKDEMGNTPLVGAAGSGAAQNITILLEAGADVNARNEDGGTPLHEAALWGTPEDVIALLEAGADATITDDRGLTPWDLANDNSKLEGTDAYWALNDARFE
jgi:ankyrin repeat protein